MFGGDEFRWSIKLSPYTFRIITSKERRILQIMDLAALTLRMIVKIMLLFEMIERRNFLEFETSIYVEKEMMSL